MRPPLLNGLEFQGKSWDKLSEGAGVGRAGFAAGAPAVKGVRGEIKSLPSYNASGNVRCTKCLRWRFGHKPGDGGGGGLGCQCAEPDFPNVRGMQAREMQAWHTAWLTEAYRVLVPGGTVKAFGGSRTFHRLAAAMETSGFELVHLEAWLYLSGFPKSLSVGKALDRQWGRLTDSSEGAVTTLKKELRKLYDASGKSRKQVDTECGFRACNYLSYPEPGKRHDPWFSVLPSTEKWAVIKQVLGVEESGVSARLDDFFREAVREVVGYRKCVPGLAFSSEGPSELPVTLPATVEAAMWEDWGTALKPAWEPVLVGRKPCE